MEIEVEKRGACRWSSKDQHVDSLELVCTYMTHCNKFNDLKEF
jgi:hypothetical protein